VAGPCVGVTGRSVPSSATDDGVASMPFHGVCGPKDPDAADVRGGSEQLREPRICVALRGSA
jgi:hypothetical protein